jgi:hypothetical protein
MGRTHAFDERQYFVRIISSWAVKQRMGPGRRTGVALWAEQTSVDAVNFLK